MPNENATNTNAARWVKLVLDSRWSESIAERAVDVPKPRLGTGKEIPAIASSQILSEDYCVISVPSIADREPAGLEYTEENITDRVSIDLRTVRKRGGEDRLYGPIDPVTLESERYGGLVGEVIRCLHSVRRGRGDYDVVTVNSVEPLSGEMGKLVSRATVEVELSRYLIGVDPTVGAES